MTKAEKNTNYPGFIMHTGRHFMVLADNEFYEAQTLILAMGVMTAKVMDREQELLGKA